MTELEPVPRRALLTISLVLATLMVSVDTTIANVAMPYMQGALSASQDQINWVLTSYIVASAVMTMPTSWLSERIGRRRFVVISIVGFTAASVLCGLAESLPQIVLFRVLQGMFGAFLVPMAQSLIFELYPPEQRAQAMSLWGMGVMVGPVIGPTLGGWLTSGYSWRWVFYVNVPFGILATVGILASLSERRAEAGRFDWTGFACLGIAVSALQLVLDRGQQLDWLDSAEITVEACVAGLAAFCFLVHISLFDRPLVMPRLFSDRNFALGSMFTLVIGIIQLSSLALITPYLQTLIGYPVMTAGLLLAPRGIGTMVGMYVCGRLLNAIGARAIMLVGFSLMAMVLHVMTGFSPDVSQTTLALTNTLHGFSVGLLFASSTTLSFMTLPADLRTQGTSMFSLLRNTGAAIGISVMGLLLQRNTQINHAHIASFITPFNPLLRAPAIARFWNPLQASGATALDAEVRRQAVIIAYSNDFKLMTIMTMIVIPMVFLLRSTTGPGAANQAAGEAAIH